MPKHVTSADQVLKGENFKYLGRFKNRKILEEGHNQAPALSECQKCLNKCEEITSQLRRRKCETNCAIEVC